MSTRSGYNAKFRKRALTLGPRPQPPGGVRYQHSLARRLDEALRKGGELRTIAEQLDVGLSVVRTHIHDRVATGRWAFDVTAEEIYGGHTVPTAGKLRETM